jgi:O-antigen ligase
VWLAYYLVLALSYFYSTNKEQSLFDLQVKLSLLVLPLIIGTFNTSRRLVDRVFLSFIAGVNVIGIFYLCRACLRWMNTGDTSHFFYHNLVEGFDAHAVYMALYTMLAISALLFMPLKQYFSKKWKWVGIALLLIDFVLFLLLSSRTLILVMLFFVAPLYLFRNIKRLPKAAIVSSIVVFMAVVVGLFATDNPIKSRYDSIVHNDIQNAWLNDYSNVDESRFSNLTVRVFAWRVGFQNLKDNNGWLTGVGNGDVKDVQNNKMRELGIRHLTGGEHDYKSGFYNLNLHNMFMQTLVMVGLPGLVLLVMMFLSPFFYMDFLKNNLVFFVFHIISFLFMMQEAGLQSQAGVVFYALFALLWWSYYYTNISSKNLKTS